MNSWMGGVQTFAAGSLSPSIQPVRRLWVPSLLFSGPWQSTRTLWTRPWSLWSLTLSLTFQALGSS